MDICMQSLVTIRCETEKFRVFCLSVMLGPEPEYQNEVRSL